MTKIHKIRYWVFGACALISLGCTPLIHDQGFTYASLPVATDTTSVGEGATIQFRGKALPLTGSAIKVGDALKSVDLAKKDLSLVDLTAAQGRVRVINIVPSLDTKVCEQQTHYLSEKNQQLDKQVELITISVDTPFAQDRFAKESKISNVTFLSDYRGAGFGKAHGLLLKGPHLLARSVMVVDQQNVVQYLQVTPDLGQLPDMDAAFQAARRLLKASS